MWEAKGTAVGRVLCGGGGGTRQERHSERNPVWKVVEAAEFAFSFEPFTFFRVYTSSQSSVGSSFPVPSQRLCMRLTKPSIYPPAVRGWLLLHHFVLASHPLILPIRGAGQPGAPPASLRVTAL